jgi:2-polyprenyl-3-methyl-5-hydroxy-6-metoxy-1,4-benzoquinol methylase
MADQGSEGVLSPFLRRRRLTVALPFLSGKILDVGCGAGELARHVSPSCYVGMDLDEASLSMARRHHPHHVFVRELPSAVPGGFETIVALAVIEHVKHPAEFVRRLARLLAPSPQAAVVLTTPHPLFAWVHATGARLGLFSRQAHEEHEAMLGRRQLEALCAECGMTVAVYRKFLGGANQLAVIKRSRP